MDRQIPLKWLALLLILWITSYAVSYNSSSRHIEKMDAFMAAGDRFTGQDGRNMAERINALEERIKLLEASK